MAILGKSYTFVLKEALSDIKKSAGQLELINLLGYQEIRQRYQRSVLGPFWLTISMAIMILCIGVVFGTLFDSQMSDFLPFLAAGLMVWGFILSSVTDGCVVFISESRSILQVPLPLSLHVFKVLWRNFLIFLHNLVIMPILMIFFGKGLSIEMLLFIPGIILLSMNLFWFVLLFAVVCARYRDIPQIISSLMQVVFYASPVLWSPNLILESGRPFIVEYNPAYYLIEIVRAPILGQAPDLTAWIVCSVMFLAGISVSLVFFGAFRNRISFWL